MRYGFLGKIAAGIAVIAVLRRATEIRAALGCFAFGRDVGAVTEHLHLAQMQKHTLTHVGDAHKAALQMFRALRPQLQRHARRIHPSHLQAIEFAGRRPHIQLIAFALNLQPLHRHVLLELLGPRFQPIQRRGLKLIQLLLQRGHLQLGGRPLLFLFIRKQADKRRLVAFVAVLGVVENREHAEVLLLTQRIVLMIMALRAGHRGAHPHLHGGVHAIDHRHVAKLLIGCTAFVVCLRVTMKCSGDQLIVGRLIEQIASQLFARELIKRHVAVERADDPIAIPPDRARLIIRVAGTVSVPRKVQPLPRPMLAIRRLGQKTVHEFLIRFRRGIRHKRRQLRLGRRQPC